MFNFWPFKKRNAQKDGSYDTHVSIEFWSERFLRISELSFAGEFVRSANEQYIIAWGKSLSKPCFVVLEHDSLLIVNRQLTKPEYGKIADTGRFIIHDTLTWETLSGVFYAFDKDSLLVPRFTKKFTGNIDTNAISPDGKYAVCDILGTDTTSEKIVFINLDSREILWKKVSPTGRPEAYEFDVDNKILYLINKRGKFRYNFDGTLLDKEAWEQSQQEHADGFELARLAEKKLAECKRPLMENRQEILYILNLAQQRLEEQPSYRAKTL